MKLLRRIVKRWKGKKRKKFETKTNISGDTERNKKGNDDNAKQNVEILDSTESNGSTQEISKETKLSNDSTQQQKQIEERNVNILPPTDVVIKQFPKPCGIIKETFTKVMVELQRKRIIKKIREEIINEQSKISNLQKWLTTASNIDEGINETKAVSKSISNFSKSVHNTVNVLTSDTNLNNNMAAVFEFASKLPQIGLMLSPIKAIIAIIKNDIDIKTTIIGIWKRLLTLLDQMTELVNWVNEKQMVGVGVDETLIKYLDLINDCTRMMKTICDDREKKNLVQKVWYAKSYSDKISSLQNKIDSDLKRWIELNGFKILYITENNAEGIVRIEDRLKKDSDTIRRIDCNIKQLLSYNLNTLEKVLDSFSKEDEIHLSDNTTTKRFMDGTREWIFDAFQLWIQSKDEKKRVLILTAPAGFGKSQIAYQLVSRNRHNTVIGWHFVRYDSSRRSNPKRMLLSIAYQLSLHLSDYKSKLEDIIPNLTKSELLSQDFNLQDIFETLLQTPLSNVTSTKTFVIVIDALDECNNIHKHDLLNCIQKYFCKLPLWLKVFITTRPEYPLMQDLHALHPMEINPSTDGNNREDLRKFFQNVLIHEDYTLSNDLDVDQATTELVTKSDGLFMVARFLVDMMKSNKDDLTLDHIRSLPNGAEKFYKQRFEESIFHNDDWSESISWKVLQLIVVAKQPMTLSLIRNIIKCELKELKKAIEKISLFLTLTSPDRKAITQNTQVSACHKSLIDWLTDTNREMEDFYVNIQKPNGLIAKYCIEFFDEQQIVCLDTAPIYEKYTELPTNFNYQSIIAVYVFKYGIQHLFDANMLKEARQILLSVGWIVIALQMKHPYHIINDYEILEDNDLVIRLIGRSIKLGSSVIQKKDWKQISCQLIGRLYSSILKRSTNDQICIQLMNFINRLKTFSYGFSWWCPIGPTWVQAETCCLKAFRRHNHTIRWVSFDPDASLVVSCDSFVDKSNEKFGSNDNEKYGSTITIWNATNDKIINDFKINGRVQTGSWGDVGMNIVSYCYESMELTVWNVAMEHQPIVLKKLYLGIKLNLINNQHLYDLQVVISPNEKHAAIVGDEVDNIKIWDIVSDQIELIGIHQQQSKWNDVTWSPNSTRVATYSKHFNKVSFWKLNINESKLDCEYDVALANDGGIDYGTSHIDWSPTGLKVAVSHGNTIFIIDTKIDNGQIVCQFPSCGFCYLVWSPVETRIAIALHESIEIWNVNDSDRECEWKQDIPDMISSLRWSKDGTKLISGSWNQSVCIWSTIIPTSTTKEYNQLPHYAIIEQEEYNDNVDKNDVESKNDSLDSFSADKVDWKDLISEQRLQSIQKNEKIVYEYVWLQYDHTMVLAMLFKENDGKENDGNDKRTYMHCNFWDPTTGKFLGYTYKQTIEDSLIEKTNPNAKCAILELEMIGWKSFCYNEQTDSETTEKKVEVIYPDVFEDVWSVHGKFAFEMNSNDTQNYFTLII